MHRKDQDLRNSYLRNPSEEGLALEIQALDGKNAPKVKAIIERYGWPTYDMVGPDASNVFWVLVQHADFDCEDLAAYILKLNQAVLDEQASKTAIPFLVDRWLVRSTGKQRYGTQFVVRGRSLRPRLYPIRPRFGLRKRRRAFGLTPLRQYVIRAKARFHPPIKRPT